MSRILTVFNEHFKYTGNINDKISSDSVYEVMVTYFPDICKKIMKIELESNGIKIFYKTFKIDGRVCRGYSGYRKKEDNYFDED